MPDSHAMHADGLLLVANGIDAVLRWDGLTDEAEPAGVLAPATAPTLSASGSGTITGTYYALVRYLDRYGNVSNVSPMSDGVTASSNGTIGYASVPVPTEAKVTRRQILRNTAGQTAVFYVDIDTTDLSGTSFSSTRTDSDLSAEEAVPLLDDNDRPLANLHAPPPDDRGVVAAHLDRMFLAGEEPVSDGSVAMTAGSATVTGAGTDWKETFAGRFLWVSGADKPYEIASVDETLQTLTLEETYAGTTDPYATYAIRPALPRRRQVFFSEAGQPESWPTTNSVSVQEDSDEIRALMPKGSFLFILCRRNSYRLTFQDDPRTDGFVFPATGRGCVNKRCWVRVDDVAYLLDEAGCYAFGGSQEVEEISAPIQDVFEAGPAARPGATPYRIQWSAARWFHAVYDPGSKVIRWFVTLSGTGYPRHALCYDPARRAWWVEEYPFYVAASCTFRLRGEPRVALGGPGGKVYLMGEGTLDGADPAKGTVRGTATSSTPHTLTDTSALFDQGIVGAEVAIVAGTGRGQSRCIVSTTATTLTTKHPWRVRPDTTSVYQIGGVSWTYRTGWFRFVDSEDETPRRLEVVFEPTEADCTLAARVFFDRSRDPVEWAYDLDSTQSMGFSSEDGDTQLVADLTKASGFVQRRLDGHKELLIDGPRFVQAELSGRSNADPITVYEATIDGAS